MNKIIVEEIDDISTVSNEATIFNLLNMTVTSVFAWK